MLYYIFNYVYYVLVLYDICILNYILVLYCIVFIFYMYI